MTYIAVIVLNSDIHATTVQSREAGFRFIQNTIREVFEEVYSSEDDFMSMVTGVATTATEINQLAMFLTDNFESVIWDVVEQS